MPPKEAGHSAQINRSNAISAEQNYGNATSLLTADEIRARPSFRSIFVRRNMVPIDFNGRAFPEYRYKYDEMMQGLDARGVADEAVANLAYEMWL
jgi:hypothetical protein